jgi:ketosteroid isomerase-like protein
MPPFGKEGSAMNDLEARLHALEDERAVLATLYRYGHSLDYGDLDSWMDLWSPTARLHWPQTGFITGADMFAEVFRAHTHAPEVYHKHLLIEPLAVVEGDRATAQSMFTRLDVYDGVPKIRSFGRYLDVLVRCPDGRWRFEERMTEVEALRPGSTDRLSRVVDSNA